MQKPLIPLAALLVACLGDMSLAQETGPSSADAPALAAQTADDAGQATDSLAADRLSLSVGSDVVTEYISRGILFAQEVSLQPGGRITVALPELEGGAITGASAYVGAWGNIRLGSVAPDAGRFFETDLYAGVSMQLAGKWNISATYFRYESPAGAFRGYDDFELIVSFDDSGAWDGITGLRNFRISPSLRMVQESGRFGRKDALYVQPSVTPSFDLALPGADLNVAVPVMIGLSDQYYDSVDGGFETFGFFRTGVLLSMQPDPVSLPGLAIRGGFEFWIPNDKVVSGLGGHDVVGRIGVSWNL